MHTPAPLPEKDLEAAKPESAKPKRRFRFWYTDNVPFMVWLRRCWLDILVQLICSVAALLIWKFAKPLMPRWFPLYSGVHTSPWGLKHGQPVHNEYITTLISGLVSFFVPFLVIAAIGIWKVGLFWDNNSALMGLGHALSVEALCVATIKWTIGGLRPHFLTLCNPVISHQDPGVGHPPIWYKPEDVCTIEGSKLNEVQYSFPSGHSAAAFAGFGYLALYINAKYKVFAHRKNLRSIPLWKLLLFLLPLMIAFIMSASKVRDGWHHTTDVVAGAILGYLFAHMAYRMVYRGVYDWRVNHIPME